MAQQSANTVSGKTVPDKSISDIVAGLNAHLDGLNTHFVGRRAMLELILLGLIMNEHVLLIGPPGTGKSAAVQAVASGLKANSFEYLIGRFTEPSELFGGLDLNALKDGRIQPVTSGMLPEADIAFLDEIFLGSTAILNSLLKILNERTYQRGQFSMKTPLISCIAASNHLPDEPLLAAFADRFMLTMFVEPVGEEQLGELLDVGWQQFADAADAKKPKQKTMPKTVITKLHKASLKVDLSGVKDSYAHIMRKLRLLGVPLSDRKIIKGQKAIAAAALLRGTMKAGLEDLWPVTYLIQDQARQGEASELLQEELKHSHNPILTESAVEASYGITAHAARLTAGGETLLAAKPALTTDQAYEIWLVRLETLLMQIDAAFDADNLPQTLRLLRTSISSHLDGTHMANTKAANEDITNEDNEQFTPDTSSTPSKPLPWGPRD